MRKTIYIADDDEDDRMFFRIAIEGLKDDITVVEAVDGKDLLDKIAKNGDSLQSSVILTDMNMPRMNGLEALFRIKSNISLQHLPVVMVSTSSDSGQIKKAYDQGINAYLIKPVLMQDYSQMAQAINVCFLNSYSLPPKQAVIRHTKLKNILVIEDNSDHYKLIKMALQHNIPEVNVTGTQDKRGTIDFLRSQWQTLVPLPQLIFLDLYLPTRQDGLDLLEEIRDYFISTNQPTVPVIVLSHSDDPKDITESYRLQANAYMIKLPDVNKWFEYFSHLCHFWWDTVALPATR